MSQNNSEEFAGGAPMMPSGTPTSGRLGAPDAGSTTAAPMPGATTTTVGQDNAPDFMAIARRATMATAMSSEGSKYVKTLKDVFENKNIASSPIKVQTLPFPPETLAITSGDNAFLLLFSEALRKEDLPVSAYTKNALQTLYSVYGSKVKLRNCIVVDPVDYNKAEVMAAALLNTLNVLESPDVQSLTLASMKKNQLEISTNPNTYEDYIRRNDPHGIPARADLCMTVSLNVPKRNNNMQVDLFSQADTDKMEIGAIGAYVVFVQAQSATGFTKFIPEIHISNICTSMPFEGMLTLFLSLAVDVLLDNRYWISQFSDLGGSNTPNIGNLIDDNQTGAPWRADNLQARDAFISQYCEPPVLILDVVEGRHRIPGLEQFVYPELSSRIIASYNKFIGTAVAPIPMTAQPGVVLAREYIGTVSVASNPVDSRYVDFLNMMIHHHAKRAMCRSLLFHYQKEEDAANIVRQFQPDLKLLYFNQMVVLTADVLRAVQAQVHAQIKTINGNAVSGTIDLSGLLTAGQGFLKSATGTIYNAQSSPYSAVYVNPTQSLF